MIFGPKIWFHITHSTFIDFPYFFIIKTSPKILSFKTLYYFGLLTNQDFDYNNKKTKKKGKPEGVAKQKGKEGDSKEKITIIEEEEIVTLQRKERKQQAYD